MKITLGAGLLCLAILSCAHNKNLAQTTSMKGDEALIKNINSSANDTDVIIPHIKTLQQQNDFVMAFGTLNFAWARKGTFYVLASKNGAWKLYSFGSKLPPSADDESVELTPQTVSAELANKIKQQYAAAALWKTNGDNGENFCTGNKSCNINDAETWTLTVTTPQNIHTTTFYAADFFEECCPGNGYRKAFVAIAKDMMKLAPAASSGTEK